MLKREVGKKPLHAKLLRAKGSLKRRRCRALARFSKVDLWMLSGKISSHFFISSYFTK
jgi:hypothetical protein